MVTGNNINSAILVWARETSGLSEEEAAEKIGLTDSEKASAVEKLRAFESGETTPTRNQLLKISSVYRRPLVAFYMDKPPAKGERGDDFRTLPGLVSKRDNALLDALLRDVRARQQMVRSLLEDEDGTEKLSFVGSQRMSEGISAVERSIRKILDIDLASQKSVRSADQLFALLRTAAEKKGIFVLLIGDLGSHHSAIDEKVFRGFVIADDIAPFIVINDQDAKSARSFTLLHELTHIWLGASGVSGSFAVQTEHVNPDGIERFCNDVAAEFLLPASQLSEMSALATADPIQILEITESIAQVWNVSQAMVAYRLLLLGRISAGSWQAVAAILDSRWRAQKARQKLKSKESDSGPSYYIVRRSKLGTALLDVVRRTLRENALTHTKAAKVLGVRASSVEPLLRSGNGAGR